MGLGELCRSFMEAIGAKGLADRLCPRGVEMTPEQICRFLSIQERTYTDARDGFWDGVKMSHLKHDGPVLGANNTGVSKVVACLECSPFVFFKVTAQYEDASNGQIHGRSLMLVGTRLKTGNIRIEHVQPSSSASRKDENGLTLVETRNLKSPLTHHKICA